MAKSSSSNNAEPSQGLKDRIKREKQAMNAGRATFFKWADVDTAYQRLLPNPQDPDGFPFVSAISIYVRKLKFSVYSLRLYNKPCPLMDRLDELRSSDPDKYERMTDFDNGQVSINREFIGRAVDPKNLGTPDSPNIMLVPYKPTMSDQIMDAISNANLGCVVMDLWDGKPFSIERKTENKRTRWAVIFGNNCPISKDDDYVDAIAKLVKDKPLKSYVRVDPDKYCEIFEELFDEVLKPEDLGLDEEETRTKRDDDKDDDRRGSRGDSRSSRSSRDDDRGRGSDKDDRRSRDDDKDDRGGKDDRRDSRNRDDDRGSRSSRDDKDDRRDSGKDDADDLKEGSKVYWKEGDTEAVIEKIKGNGKFLLSYKDKDGDELTALVAPEDVEPVKAEEKGGRSRSRDDDKDDRGGKDDDRRSRDDKNDRDRSQERDDDKNRDVPKYKFEDVKEGDIITFKLDNDELTSEVIQLKKAAKEILVVDPDNKDDKNAAITVMADEIIHIESPKKGGKGGGKSNKDDDRSSRSRDDKDDRGGKDDDRRDSRKDDNDPPPRSRRLGRN